jgi:YgiT-type zinc finger domain-containing protein
MGAILHITICPTCGSDKIKKVRRNWTGKHQGKVYTVPSLEFYECPVCGERVYDRMAMKKIESRSPAFAETASTAKRRLTMKPKAA